MSPPAGARTPPPGKNRLYFEKSPYLLQHAGNPVDWLPWGDEAFERARTEDKPVFLSIGYSTCHWCHVMERESFEDEAVAAAMNETFVCIKVDREERPDVDGVYMTVCQMITGSGGWPLTLFLTADREPFFAATYIPRDSMLDLVPRVKNAWQNNRPDLLENTGEIVSALGGITAGAPGDTPGLRHLQMAATELESRFDPDRGGFGSAPKFPAPHNLTFLLRYWKRTGDVRFLGMVEKTLKSMRRGGIYDQVGFGFHRYSTDQRWFLPHFEKMLYDQALLAMAYTETFQATGNPEYRGTAEEILQYVLRDMTDVDGGYYSAEDADSEGEEGKYYLWTEQELKELLGGEAGRVIDTFGVEPAGNWTEEATGHRPGSNILFVADPGADVAGEAVAGWWEPLRKRLFEHREERVRPLRDDKILTDWNGLMIAAMAMASRVFDEPRYVESAALAVAFIEEKMTNPAGGLFHRYRDGLASIESMVDDYAFFVWGLLEMYQTTYDPRYLKSAKTYTDYALDHFWDADAGGLFFSAENGDRMIVRSKEVYDGAVPSGNSVAAMNLVRLARITAETGYEERAREIGRAFEQQLKRGPSAFTQLLSAVDYLEGPSFEIVITGTAGQPDTREMIRAVNRVFVPNKVVVFRPEPGAGTIVDLAPYTRAHKPLDDSATAYVCRNYACELPTVEIPRMLELMGI